MDKVLTEQQKAEAESYWRRFKDSVSDAEVYLCEALAAEGRFDSLIWAHGRGFQFTDETCARAAFGGHLEILKWLRKKGCPWNEGVCARAAYKGRVQILEWLREEGCPWDEFSVSHAAGQGHFETVKWLVENGCPWTQFAIQRAQKKEIGDYLKDSSSVSNTNPANRTAVTDIPEGFGDDIVEDEDEDEEEDDEDEEDDDEAEETAPQRSIRLFRARTQPGGDLYGNILAGI